MSTTLSVRLPEDLAAWLRAAAQRSGLPQGEIVRAELERARQAAGEQSFLRLAGQFRGGPPDVSLRKGYSKR